MMHKLILVDDHKMFLDGLLNILEEIPSIEIVLKTDNAKTVITYLEHHDPVDLIVSDISMPDISGVELSAYVKKKNPDTKMLIVSMHNNPSMYHKLKQINVDGYIQKNASKTVLLEAVKTILGGSVYFSERIKQTYNESLFQSQKIKDAPLSDRELEVLKLIALENTTNEIAKQLFISKHTVETYRKNLLLKLDAKNLAGLTKHAIYLGLV
ncbi:response regulator [Marixanthomonas spongiae]|uniref:DNA-binding response regulator n=1 Tax=Marixanthomonas spongiae TaxID=2174845 RepID=A0A2U0HSA4_9FLAO|nr:response regulator transcription factor [Marixanthomonas spongiae]PVW11724.1 DNA-binding response regulator [Marixanthomonas spongiae]